MGRKMNEALSNKKMLLFKQWIFCSWYFGPLTRQEATDILLSEVETGVFLVRNSATIHGDLVLCVREDSKVSHYIINRVQQDDQTRFRIGDQMFPDVPSLLNFYKLHYLDTTPLMRPVS
ncbi:UNVERIFIED_CONTAM: Crk [Trichonephila clavipes]